MNHYLRKQFSPIGWALIGLNFTMGLFLMIAALPEIFGVLAEAAMNHAPFPGQQVFNAINASYAGYYAWIVLGLGAIVAFEGPRFWREELWQKREPMTFGAFFAIAGVFLGLQLVASILGDVLNALANLFHRDILQIYVDMELMSQDQFSAFVYSGILAPIWEEILFRGWIQHRLRPYGKTFAILFTALLFGLFHGNLAQIPLGILAGLVLSYTAEHYSLAWCMVLHMVNNLLITDLIPRLTAYLPDVLNYGIQNGLLLLCSLAGAVTLWHSRHALRAEFDTPMDPRVTKAFFLNPGILAFLAMTIKNCWDAMYYI